MSSHLRCVQPRCSRARERELVFVQQAELNTRACLRRKYVLATVMWIFPWVSQCGKLFWNKKGSRVFNKVYRARQLEVVLETCLLKITFLITAPSSSDAGLDWMKCYNNKWEVSCKEVVGVDAGFIMCRTDKPPTRVWVPNSGLGKKRPANMVISLCLFVLICQ